MKKFILIVMTVLMVCSLFGCGNNLINDNQKLIIEESTDDESPTLVDFSGVITKIAIFNSYREVTINDGEEEKTFMLTNSTKLIDMSHHPKVEPYIEVGTYVTIKVLENEYNEKTPKIRMITITSYDGIFLV